MDNVSNDCYTKGKELGLTNYAANTVAVMHNNLLKKMSGSVTPEELKARFRTETQFFENSVLRDQIY